MDGCIARHFSRPRYGRRVCGPEYGVHTDQIITLNAVNDPAATPLLSTLPEVRTLSHPSRAR